MTLPILASLHQDRRNVWQAVVLSTRVRARVPAQPGSGDSAESPLGTTVMSDVSAPVTVINAPSSRAFLIKR